MVGVAEHDAAAPLVKHPEGAGQLHVIGFAELTRCVPLEVRVLRYREVRRVEIDEVAPARFLDGFPKVFRLEFGITERPCGGKQVVAVVERRVLGRADRRVELALGVDPIETVETGLVEEDRASRTLQVVCQVVHATHLVVVILATRAKSCGVLVEKLHQLLGAVADDAVAVNQFLVAVPQERPHVREPAFQMEEHCAAAEERFDVSLNLDREELIKLAEQVRFASRPFQKRLGLDTGNVWSIGEGQRLLLIESVQRTVGFTAGRDRNVAPTICRWWELTELAGEFGFWLWIGSLIRPHNVCGLSPFCPSPQLHAHPRGSIPIYRKGSRSKLR